MELRKVADTVRKILPNMHCGAVIVAAGNATRMGGIDKVMAPLCGEPIIVHSVRAFQNSDAIQEIVVVTREDLIAPITALLKDMNKVIAVVAGGKSRQESVRMGLNTLSSGIRLAAVHDGARPLISNAVIDRTVRAAFSYGAAAPGIAVKDTVKVVRGGVIMETPERASLRAIQTPQIFDYALLRGALVKAEQEGAELTDDCSAVERLGMSVRVVEGDERNLKVTTPLDLKIAEILMEEMK